MEERNVNILTSRSKNNSSLFLLVNLFDTNNWNKRLIRKRLQNKLKRIDLNVKIQYNLIKLIKMHRNRSRLCVDHQSTKHLKFSRVKSQQGSILVSSSMLETSTLIWQQKPTRLSKTCKRTRSAIWKRSSKTKSSLKASVKF